MYRLGLIVISVVVAASALADATLVWDKRPLDITLPVGRQRYISFPDKVAFGLPADYQDVLDVQNANQTLYLTAARAFPPHQFQIKTAGNQVILVNISAQQTGSTEPLKVIEPDPEVPAPKQQADTSEISLRTLMRYAIQQYYAPRRLLQPNAAIHNSGTFKGETYALFPSGAVTTIPLASYSGGGLTVTAVYVQNAIDMPVNLRPDQLCGTWMGVTFFPQSRLNPAGQTYDDSMLFLVSQNDFTATYKGSCGLGAGV